MWMISSIQFVHRVSVSRARGGLPLHNAHVKGFSAFLSGGRRSAGPFVNRPFCLISLALVHLSSTLFLSKFHQTKHVTGWLLQALIVDCKDRRFGFTIHIMRRRSRKRRSFEWISTEIRIIPKSNSEIWFFTCLIFIVRELSEEGKNSRHNPGKKIVAVTNNFFFPII